EVELSEVGDFDKNQAFSFGAWVRTPRSPLFGSVFARMDVANGHRGWDLWVENGRFGAHIVHSWPGNAIKVIAQAGTRPGEWNHLFITYDGSGKAAGVKIYLNGMVQEARAVGNDTLTGTTRTTVPFK